MKVVLPFVRVSNALWIFSSVWVSILLVASSSISMGGFISIILAIVISCL